MVAIDNPMSICCGVRFRNGNYDMILSPATHTPQIVSCPSYGELFICEACLKGPMTNLTKHQTEKCCIWNAQNRINNGYRVTHQAGTEPNYVGLPPHHGPTNGYRQICGEQLRIIFNKNMLTPAIIMGQRQSWNPYSPIENLPGMIPLAWTGQTFDSLVEELYSYFPITVLTSPRRPSHDRAISIHKEKPDTTSLTHLKHMEDERSDAIAINNFVQANNLVALIQNDPGNNINDWTQTSVYRLAHNIPDLPPGQVGIPGHIPTQYVPLSPIINGEDKGVAKVGNAGGVTPTRRAHRAQTVANAAAGTPRHAIYAMNNDDSWSGTGEDHDYKFAMPGTPGGR